MEDEEEYLDFYDFTKTYQNHPDAVVADKPVVEDKVEEVSNESWEDCEEGSVDPEDLDEGFKIVDDSEQSFQVFESKIGVSPGKDKSDS